MSKLFQSIIHQMKDAVADRTIGVIDENGIVISCTQLGMIGEARHGIREEVAYSPEVFVSGEYTYRAIGNASKPDYVVFVEGADKEAERLAMLIGISLSNIKTLHDEKYDKASFVKNVILDNILPSDIYVKSKELLFDAEVCRVVYLVKFSGKGEGVPFDLIQNIFPDRSKDFVISVGEQDIVIVKEHRMGVDSKTVEKIAHQIDDTMSSEFFTKVSIGIGTPVENIKDLSRSYKEAQVAIEVGKVFENEKSIISYENLGIGRLIYQLPTTLCEMFLQEVFKKGSFESLDRETLMTIQCFFENNLNVSETSRKLFVHRNTLVYRLEKIKKLTGLDLREFEHAITFKVALMVKRYLASKPVKY